MHKRRKKILLASLLLTSGSFLSGAALLVADGLRDDIHPADVAIVLGNTVESDGRPSARLRARLDKAMELYRGGLFQHVIDGRFVRWLLMFQDRAEADEFELTHEFMAEMLGVTRSSVGEAARKLQEMGLVSYDRGASASSTGRRWSRWPANATRSCGTSMTVSIKTRPT